MHTFTGGLRVFLSGIAFRPLPGSHTQWIISCIWGAISQAAGGQLPMEPIHTTAYVTAWHGKRRANAREESSKKYAAGRDRRKSMTGDGGVAARIDAGRLPLRHCCEIHLKPGLSLHCVHSRWAPYTKWQMSRRYDARGRQIPALLPAILNTAAAVLWIYVGAQLQLPKALPLYQRLSTRESWPKSGITFSGLQSAYLLCLDFFFLVRFSQSPPPAVDNF